MLLYSPEAIQCVACDLIMVFGLYVDPPFGSLVYSGFICSMIANRIAPAVNFQRNFQKLTMDELNFLCFILCSGKCFPDPSHGTCGTAPFAYDPHHVAKEAYF